MESTTTTSGAWRKALSILMAIVLVVGLAPMPKQAYATTIVPATVGTQALDVSGDAVTIASQEDMNDFIAEVNKGTDFSTKTVSLTATNLTVDTAIGTSSNPANIKLFNGNKNTVNLDIKDSSDDNQGLFGYVGSIEITNLVVTGNVTGGTAKNYGGIIGFLTGMAKLTNVGNEATVSANGYSSEANVGGLIGGCNTDWTNGNGVYAISGCYNKGSITGANQYVGGLVGRDQNDGLTTTCSIKNSYNLGAVRGNGAARIGGFLGGSGASNDNLTIENSYNAGTVSGSDEVDAFVGWRNSDEKVTFTNSYYDSDVVGATCWSSAAVGKTTTALKGLVGTLGDAYKAVDGGYPALTWESDSSSNPEPTVSGITFNLNEGSWASDYTAPETYTEGTGLTLPTASGISRDGYEFAGWFDNEDCTGTAVTAISTTDTGAKTFYAKWDKQYVVIKNDTGLPTGCSFDVSPKQGKAGTEITVTPNAGTGYTAGAITVVDAESNPVTVTDGKFNMPASNATVTVAFEEKQVTTIATADELISFATAVNGGTTYEGETVQLTADIDLTGKTWTPIGTYNPTTYSGYLFKGTFDGNGKTISGLTITGSSKYQALFSTVSDATIQNLIVKGSVAGAEAVAGVVAYATGATTIKNVGNEVAVTGGAYANWVAGVVAEYAGSSLVINNCYNKAAISGASKVGGIFGGYANTGSATITSCYNAGTVTGDSQAIGGIAGGDIDHPAADVVTNCVNTGTVTGGTGVTAKTPGAIIGAASNAPTSADNANYWLASSCDQANGGSNSTVTVTQNTYNVSKTADEMKAAGFATTLGTAYKAVAGDYPALAWEGTSADPEPVEHSVTIECSGQDESEVCDVTPYLQGTYTMMQTKFVANDKVALYVDLEDGYRLKSLVVKDGEGTTITPEKDGSYLIFTMPDSDVTVTATFEEIVYTVKVADGLAGTVLLDNATTQTFKYGECADYTLTATPSTEGYVIDNVSFADENGDAINYGVTWEPDGSNTTSGSISFGYGFGEGGEFNSIVVTVTFMAPEMEHKITADEGIANGSIKFPNESYQYVNPSATFTKSTGLVNFKVIADEKYGYDPDSVIAYKKGDTATTYTVSAGSADGQFSVFAGFEGNKRVMPDNDVVVTATFKKLLSASTVFGFDSRYKYNGEDRELAFSWGEKKNGDALTKGDDYDITYKLNGVEKAALNEKGDYTVTMTGKGDYIGTYTFTVSIVDYFTVYMKEKSDTSDGLGEVVKVYSESEFAALKSDSTDLVSALFNGNAQVSTAVEYVTLEDLLTNAGITAAEWKTADSKFDWGVSGATYSYSELYDSEGNALTKFYPNTTGVAGADGNVSITTDATVSKPAPLVFALKEYSANITGGKTAADIEASNKDEGNAKNAPRVVIGVSEENYKNPSGGGNKTAGMRLWSNQTYLQVIVPDKQEQKITTAVEDSVTKSYDADPFSLGATVLGGAELTYASSNEDVVTVDDNGLVTVKGVGTSTITIKAAHTAEYGAATKTITVTVEDTRVDLSASTTKWRNFDDEYGCTGEVLSIVPKVNGTELNPATDFTIRFQKDDENGADVEFKDVGTYWVTITGKGNYKNSYSKKVTISPYFTVYVKEKGDTSAGRGEAVKSWSKAEFAALAGDETTPVSAIYNGDANVATATEYVTLEQVMEAAGVLDTEWRNPSATLAYGSNVTYKYSDLYDADGNVLTKFFPNTSGTYDPKTKKTTVTTDTTEAKPAPFVFALSEYSNPIGSAAQPTQKASAVEAANISAANADNAPRAVMGLTEANYLAATGDSAPAQTTGNRLWSNVCYLQVTVPAKAEQTIAAADVTKTFGDAPFALGATALGGAELTYASSDPAVATVAANGTVTVVGAGTATITINAARTGAYRAATKAVTVTVNKKTIAAPKVNTGLVYTGKTLTGVNAGTGYTLSGNTGVDAKSYTATATAAANYQFSGSNPSKVTIPWTIAKAANPFTGVTAKSATQTVSYSTKAQTIALTKFGLTPAGAINGVTYALASTTGKGITVLNGNVVIPAKLAGGKTYDVVLNATAAGNANYNASAVKQVTVKVTVNKLSQKITAKNVTVTYKGSKLVKKKKLAKNQTINVKSKAKVSAKTTVKYKKSNTKGGKLITVNAKTGKITVKKGLKKGTYKVGVKLTAAASNAYSAAKAKTIYVTIKVK